MILRKNLIALKHVNIVKRGSLPMYQTWDVTFFIVYDNIRIVMRTGNACKIS